MGLEMRAAENELMRAALDAARIGLCVIDSEGVVIVLGGDVAARLGTRADALVGQHYRNLLATGLALRAGSELFALDAPETSAEVRMSRTDGSVTMLMIQARTLVHGDTHRFRVLTLIDLVDFGVTRERFMELRRELDALNSAVMVLDARAPEYPIAYVNSRFEQMTGYPADQAIGRSGLRLLSRDTDQPGVHKLSEAILRRQGCQVLVNSYRRDGSAFLDEVMLWPLFDESGELSHFLSMHRECNGRLAPIAGKEGG